jgi:hypothetical protein
MNIIHLGKKASFCIFFIFLIFLIFVVFFIFLYDKDVEASEMKNYRLYFSGEDAIFDIRVNGLPVVKNRFPRELTSSEPINHMLVPGDNEIVVNFVQSSIQNNEVNLDKKLSNDFFVSVRLDAESNSVNDSVDVVYIEQDGDEYVTSRKSLKNLEYNDSGDVVGIKGFSAFLKSKLVTGFGVEYDSYMVRIKFHVDDDNLEEPFWDDAVSFELTADVKKKLINEYKEIRRMIKENDGEAYLDTFSNVWDRTAKSYGLGDKEYFVKNMDAMNPKDLGEGRSLGSFEFSEDEYNFEHFNNGKFIRLFPTPIYWGDYYIRVSPVFYLDKNMNLRAVAIATDS